MLSRFIKASVWSDWVRITYNKNTSKMKSPTSQGFQLDKEIFLKLNYQKYWQTITVCSPSQPLTGEGRALTDVWLCCVVIPHFCLVWPWNVGENRQLFLIYRHRQILACCAALHGLAEACVLIIDTRHLLGSLRVSPRHPVCVVWVDLGGGGGRAFWSCKWVHGWLTH